MRFSLLQLMMIAVLVGLVSGLVASSRQHGGMQTTHSLEFSPDGLRLVAAHGDRILTWRNVEGRFQPSGAWSRRGLTYVDGKMFWLPDNESVIVQEADSTGVTELVRYAYTGKTLSRFRLPRREQIAVSADGRRVAISRNGVIEVYRWGDAENPVQTIAKKLDGWSSTMALSPDGAQLAVVEARQVNVWELATGRKRTTPHEDDGPGFVRATYSPDGRYLAWTGSGLVLDLETDQVLNEAKFLDAPIGAVWWTSEPGASFVVASAYPAASVAKARLPDTDNVSRQSLSGDSCTVLTGSRDGRWLAGALGDRIEVMEWAATDNRQVLHQPRPTLFVIVYAAGFILWGVAWGWLERRNRHLQRGASESEDWLTPAPDASPASSPPAPPTPPTQPRGGWYRGALEAALVISVVLFLLTFGLCVLGTLGGVVATVMVLLFLLPAVGWGVYRAEYVLDGGGVESAEESLAEAQPTPHVVVGVWIASLVAGVSAIVFPTCFVVYTGIVFNPFWYYSLLVGVFSIAQAVGRSHRRLALIAGLQVGCLLGCDVVSFVIGSISLSVLQSSGIRRYRRRALLSEA